MKRKLKLVLELTIEDLSEKTRKECWDDMCLSEYPDEVLSTASDFSHNEYAYLVVDALGADYFSEMIFEGSDVYGQITAAELSASEWIGEWEGEMPSVTY